MGLRRRDSCLGLESDSLIWRGENQPTKRSLTSRQLYRLAWPKPESAFLRELEAGEAAAKNNRNLFLQAFSPAKLLVPGMERKSSEIFENPAYNASLPRVLIVYALTHLNRGSIVDFALDDVEGYLEEFPGHGMIMLGVSFKPGDNAELDVNAALLPEINAVKEAGFSRRAIGVVQDTINQINQPAQ